MKAKNLKTLWAMWYYCCKLDFEKDLAKILCLLTKQQAYSVS